MKSIVINGATQNNLKDISIQIPYQQLVVVTGPSGSGKSSLVIDTIYAESQRRFFESLPFFACQVMGSFERPQVGNIEGLPPALLMTEQKEFTHSRSTVSTRTDIHDLLRLLLIKSGDQYCLQCDQSIQKHSIDEVIQELTRELQDEKVCITTPLSEFNEFGTSRLIQRLLKEGLTKLVAEGHIYDLNEGSEDLSLTSLLIDRIKINGLSPERLFESIEFARGLSQGLCEIRQNHEPFDVIKTYSEKPYCIKCRLRAPTPALSLLSFNRPEGACLKCKGLGRKIDNNRICSSCGGSRFNERTKGIKIYGRHIADLCLMRIDDLYIFLNDQQETDITASLLSSLLIKLKKLRELGLGYIELSRGLDQLSYGEKQKIEMAVHLCSDMSGLLYIFDEPTRGLHPKEFKALLNQFNNLKKKGNSLIVIEHDPTIIAQADLLIQMGPGSGPEGGEIVKKSFEGRVKRSVHCKKVSSNLFVKVKSDLNNLKINNLKFPLYCLTCVTGVSGSGKSSLVMGALAKNISDQLKKNHIKSKGKISKLVLVDARLTRRNLRSTLCTLSGVLTPLRSLLAMVSEAKIRGYRSSRFNLNTKGGRCEACEGLGKKKIKMHFLADMYLLCDVCEGRRFNLETLSVHYRGKNIDDILNFSVQEANLFFRQIPKLKKILDQLQVLGLGYVKLGQSSLDLSSGELQRIKLARELANLQMKEVLYIFDEPTKGLGSGEIEKFIELLYKIRDRQNHIVVIDHHEALMDASDHIIELGPGAGPDGGRVIYEGSREKYTG